VQGCSELKAVSEMQMPDKELIQQFLSLF